MSFTDETVAENVEDAKANNSQLPSSPRPPWCSASSVCSPASVALPRLRGPDDAADATTTTDGTRTRASA